jgi:ATP-dependent helicase HrpB
VLARRFVRLDAITLEEKPLQDVPVEAARMAMLEGMRELGVSALPWTRDARDLQARIEFARRMEEGDRARDPRYAVAAADNSPRITSGPAETASATPPAPGGNSWPAVSDEALAATTDVWLAPWLDGVTRRDHLARLSLTEILRALLPWDKQRELDQLAPTHLQVPSGSNIRIDYLDESAPAVSVRLQEVFGLDATPRIGGGRVPITFKLLSPAQRPVQVTRDLASFWRGSYADVRKDMRGRYPKHYWPENPLEAEATRGARRRT